MKGQDELGFDVDPFEKAFGQLAGPVHWPSLTETERLQAFGDLRAEATEYYVAGRRIPAVYNGMATAADWMSAASSVTAYC